MECDTMASSGDDRVTWTNYDRQNHRPHMDKSNRAKIFLPFNALEGLYETLEEKELKNEDRIELSDDEAQLLNYIEFSSVNKTEVLRITVETESPELSFRIADAYSDIASKALENIVGSGSVTILSHPKLPTVQSFPSVPKFTVLFGFVFVVILVITS